VSGTRNLLMKL